MRYYLLSNGRLKPEMLPLTVLDKAGDSLINKYGYDLSNIDICYFNVVDRFVPVDKLPSIGMQLILSERASAVMTQHLRINDRMRRVPAIVRDSRKGTIISDAYNLWWSSTNEVVHLEKSDIEWYKDRILSVRKWVLDLNNVPDCDIFLGDTAQWIVTQQFVNVITEFEVTGCSFEEVETSSGS